MATPSLTGSTRFIVTCLFLQILAFLYVSIMSTVPCCIALWVKIVDSITVLVSSRSPDPTLERGFEAGYETKTHGVGLEIPERDHTKAHAHCTYVGGTRHEIEIASKSNRRRTEEKLCVSVIST